MKASIFLQIRREHAEPITCLSYQTRDNRLESSECEPRLLRYTNNSGRNPRISFLPPVGQYHQGTSRLDSDARKDGFFCSRFFLARYFIAPHSPRASTSSLTHTAVAAGKPNYLKYPHYTTGGSPLMTRILWTWCAIVSHPHLPPSDVNIVCLLLLPLVLPILPLFLSLRHGC